MKSVFITGAAAGIGLATARYFARAGWHVGLYDINPKALAEVLDSNDFPHASSGHCDVTSRSSVEAAMTDFANHTGGQMHVLVNNAGVVSVGPFQEITPESIDAMVDVNVRGFTHVAQSGFPYLEKTGDACMVGLCSASSIHGVPNLAVYAASKAYVNAMTQALHIEWARHGIRVTCVKPYLVNTAMVRDNDPGDLEVRLQPDDIARAIDRAVRGRRISYMVGREAHLWGVIDKCLPERLRMVLTRSLTKLD